MEMEMEMEMEIKQAEQFITTMSCWDMIPACTIGGEVVANDRATVGGYLAVEVLAKDWQREFPPSVFVVSPSGDIVEYRDLYDMYVPPARRRVSHAFARLRPQYRGWRVVRVDGCDPHRTCIQMFDEAVKALGVSPDVLVAVGLGWMAAVRKHLRLHPSAPPDVQDYADGFLKGTHRVSEDDRKRVEARVRSHVIVACRREEGPPSPWGRPMVLSEWDSVSVKNLALRIFAADTPYARARVRSAVSAIPDHEAPFGFCPNAIPEE